jgi:transcriptional regulator with XRE-family HTH domain
VTSTELAALRLALGLTYRELGEMLGVGTRHVQRLVAGSRPITARLELQLRALADTPRPPHAAASRLAAGDSSGSQSADR